VVTVPGNLAETGLLARRHFFASHMTAGSFMAVPDLEAIVLRHFRSGHEAWLTLLVLLALLAPQERLVLAQTAPPIQPGAILFTRLSGSNFHSDSLAEL
jgi:hypothetical protein